MDVTTFYEHVTARLPPAVDLDAEALTDAVLHALAERLSPEEAAELGMELPEELGDLLAHASGDGRLDREEFLEALAAQLDVDDDDAEAGAQAVLKTLREALEPVLPIEQVLSSLPSDLAQMMG